MAKARAAAAAKRAAAGFVPKVKKESTSPARVRRTKEEIAADKAATAAAKANRPPIDRAAQMAKARAVAAANRAAKGIAPKPKPVSDGPKMTKAEALAKGRAVAAANRAAKALLAEAPEAPATGMTKKKAK